MEIPKIYNPKDFEDKIFSKWSENNVFNPDYQNNTDKKFSIVMPPPNVTAQLHLGHALNITLQDILVRYKMMNNYKVLWIVGTDHAGIATQMVAKNKLKEQGIDSSELNRDEFLNYIIQIKDTHRAQIINQIKKMGASVDFSREKFTLDKDLNEAVNKVFKDLFKEGFIYKGTYLINWSVALQSALSDEEVEYKEINGKLYYFYYPIKDSSEKLIVATTRPETILGDSALAVNPEDNRYKNYIGKKALVPIINREIPIIADSYVDKDFGSGVVKITPSHDPNDYNIAIKHNLDFINIINKDGTLNKNTPLAYQNLTREQARIKIIEDLKNLDLFIESKKHIHKVGHCYRSNTIIEPLISNQWFIKMKELAKAGLLALEKEEIKFYPKYWQNTYTHWLNNIKDWCISRQLIWGHRIPAFYCKNQNCSLFNKVIIDQEFCKECNNKLIQDDDVLDTWFSSWLWPFSTLKWLEDSDDFKEFYPTNTLITAYDIIFFWVARMVIAGYKFTNKAPFKDIYITPLIRDNKGKKMSKSLGNGIDPLEIIEEYGTDALKFSFAYLSIQGQDILISKDSFKLGSKFVNKIWNATRFLLLNIEQEKAIPEIKDYNVVDKWIIYRLAYNSKKIKEAFDRYDYAEASHLIYDFFWNDFCDWYIEISKEDLKNNKIVTLSKLLFILKNALKLLHPFMSFVTEELYSKLSNDLLIKQNYPKEEDFQDYSETALLFKEVKDIVTKIRTLRSEFKIDKKEVIKVSIITEIAFIKDQAYIISSLSNVELTFEHLEDSICQISELWTIELDIKNLVDIEKIKEQFKKELNILENRLSQIEKRLSNKDFLNKADKKVIYQEEINKNESLIRIKKIKDYLRSFLI